MTPSTCIWRGSPEPNGFGGKKRRARRGPACKWPAAEFGGNALRLILGACCENEKAFSIVCRLQPHRMGAAFFRAGSDGAARQVVQRLPVGHIPFEDPLQLMAGRDPRGPVHLFQVVAQGAVGNEQGFRRVLQAPAADDFPDDSEIQPVALQQAVFQPADGAVYPADGKLRPAAGRAAVEALIGRGFRHAVLPRHTSSPRSRMWMASRVGLCSSRFHRLTAWTPTS